MELPIFESEFFGSGVLWLLLTFPAYWLYQWTIEGEPFHVWRRAAKAVKTASEVSQAVTHSLVEVGTTLAGEPEPVAAETAWSSLSD